MGTLMPVIHRYCARNQNKNLPIQNLNGFPMFTREEYLKKRLGGESRSL